MLDTRELGRRPGSMLRLRRTVPTGDDLGLDLARVPAGGEVELALRLESVLEGVLVTGAAEVDWQGECARCLDPVRGRIAVEFRELYAYPDSATEGTTDDDETGRLDGDLLDVGPALRDAVVLALPLQPRCAPDCPGLCPRCGAPLAGDPGHDHADVDPRWAALAGLARAAAPASPSSGPPTHPPADEDEER